MADKPTDGNDTIRGFESFDDNIDALAGNDTIFGLSGDDTLSGGEGNDSIRGGDDADDIFAGNDISSNNFNRLFGDDGNDTITGSLGRDSLFGGADQDDLFGKANSDFLDGGDGSDILFGGTGDDIVVGGSGRDFIQGTDQFGNGINEIDILDGNEDFGDRDTFVLGNASRVFYDDGNANTQGNNDLAAIEGFGTLDRIQLHGGVDYRLENVNNLPGSGFSGVGVFVDNSGGTADEIIGVIQNVDISQLNIFDSGNLKFIT